MERSFFRQVKEALSANAQATLEQLGVNLKHGLKGEWSQCLCPFCGDQSGSASVTHQGFLRCHQCGRKQDICEWYGELAGITDWEACKIIGGMLNVNMEVKKHRGRPPKSMTHEILRGAVHSLWESEQADSCRSFLRKRKLDDAMLLERFGVGFIGGYIVFAQWTPTGHLRTCYRCYTPGGRPPWLWKGGTRGGTLGFWPHFQLPADGVLWLLEGEFDVATAWMRLRLQDQGIFAVTWTGGAGSPIKPYAIPDSWRGREIHIVPDNDVFQGPVLEEHRAPNPQRKRELERRWANLMNEVAPSFLAQNCKVFLRSIPIDPLEIWGGDFRDWVDRGGRDLDELTPHLFKDLRPAAKAPVETDFLGVYELAGKDVKTSAEVSSINADGLTVPTCIALVCEMGSMPYCANCKAPARFEKGMIHCKDHRDDMARALMARDRDVYIMRHVVGKPPSCTHAKLEVVEYEVCSKWTAVHDDMEEANERELTVISKERPSLSGDIEVVGHVHHANNSVMVMADKLRQLDRAEVDLTPVMSELAQLTPWQSEDPQVMDEYLQRRCADLACNVTKIYGRQPLHLTHELLAHSPLWMTVEGLRTRGWLDLCIIGDTGTGKSMTFQRLMDHHKLGTWMNCVQNISRAGLTMGAISSNEGVRLRPGIFPRNHRKMLIIDEFHHAVKEGIMSDLQGARDDGRVFGAKVYGSRVMPAAVRFGAIGNWPYDREKFRFMCEHFMAIYGTPEALRRADFGLVVHDEPTETALVEAEYEWGSDLVQALILRAWAMDETMIHVSDAAIRYARQKCQEWTGYYDHEMPFFTPEEKHYSMLRLATALANICFSHPQGEPYQVRVSTGHVEWAVTWLQRTFVWNGYDQYSQVTMQKQTLERPFDAEAEFSVSLNLGDAADASALLPQFLGGFTVTECVATLGKEPYDVARWLNKMIRLNVLFQTRNTKNTHLTEIRLTKAGNTLVRNMLMCADDFPDQWDKRYRKLSSQGIGPISTLNMPPMTDSRSKLRHEWSDG